MPGETLGDSLARARTLWQAARAVAAQPDRRWDVVDGLFRALLTQMDRVRDGELARAPGLAPRIDDVEAQLTTLLRRSEEQRAEALDSLATSLTAALEQFEPIKPPVPAAIAEASTPGPPPSRVLQQDDLSLYERDARGQARLMWGYAVVAGGLVVVLVATTGWFAVKASPKAGLALPLTAFGVLALLAFAAGQQARECRRALFETRRVQRQLLTLDKYLSPLPELGRDLLRSVMVQRLFPRLIDDDNPMREDELFPPTDDLLLALSPQMRNDHRRSSAATTGPGPATGQATASAAAPPGSTASPASA